PWVCHSGDWTRPPFFASGQIFSGSVSILSNADDQFIRLDWNVQDQLRNNGQVGTDTPVAVGSPRYTQVVAGTGINVTKGVGQFATTWTVGVTSGGGGGGSSTVLSGQNHIQVTQTSPGNWNVGDNVSLSGLMYSGAINNNTWIYAPAFSGTLYPAPGGG